MKFEKKKYPNLKDKMIIVKIDKRYFRPNEVENLIGNASKSQKILKWKSRITIDQLVKEMLSHDLKSFSKK